MTEAIHQFADYDRWATVRLLDRSMELGEGHLDAPATSSFGTLRLTWMHIRDACHVWYCRLIGQVHRWPAEESSGMESVLRYVDPFHNLVVGMDPRALQQVVRYSDLAGNAYEQPAWQLILHCLNHSTFHRGQVVTQLRQLGQDRIPRTDLVAYQRT
ncbi:MAG: hypothetical protein KDB88_02770 [Flavobacteriales bacterium]|nr:hypothetical protein [Flavobacteriales bacterium]